MPAGMAASEPSCQKPSSFSAECASRFQFAEFIACQTPLRFGCPAMRAGRAALRDDDCCALLGTAVTTAAAATSARAILLLSCMLDPPKLPSEEKTEIISEARLCRHILTAVRKR